MENNMKHLIAAAALAALAATGTAMAQSTPASTATDKASSLIKGGQDDGKEAKTQAKSKKNAATSTTGNPISVTPPSADNPQTSVDVNTDPAKAHADAGPAGVNANANLDGTKGNNPAKPVTDKLARKKDEKKQ